MFCLAHDSASSIQVASLNCRGFTLLQYFTCNSYDVFMPRLHCVFNTSFTLLSSCWSRQSFGPPPVYTMPNTQNLSVPCQNFTSWDGEYTS